MVLKKRRKSNNLNWFTTHEDEVTCLEVYVGTITSFVPDSAVCELIKILDHGSVWS